MYGVFFVFYYLSFSFLTAKIALLIEYMKQQKQQSKMKKNENENKEEREVK